MNKDTQQPAEIDESTLEQAVGGLSLTRPGMATNTRTINLGPNLGRVAEGDSGFSPDTPDEPKYR